MEGCGWVCHGSFDSMFTRVRPRAYARNTLLSYGLGLRVFCFHVYDLLAQ